ncbi:MAG: LytR family transcriptional regulator [Acidimicrobiaceae bacterium]|nr:LytR family transcriptional regulator [Acidimicrobiaceae bacterium]MYE96032.1 LytR family transcriptional regulator [Acidimicrobiaceae bacterium]MYI54803.1 LytR family transcriptional regulator [Acidimicrobiaceae bacterium]MYJ43153.1 LytR family transcriptional regulator [Acidimicrobiaceae bacterium]
MTDQGKPRLRRTWPQRLVVVASLLVIVSALASARTVQYVEEVWEQIDRVPVTGTVQYGQELLRPDTEPGEPVNFLIVGTDSGTDVASTAAAAQAGGVATSGKSLADVIMLLHLDPKAKSAWVLSIPRDLWAEIPGAQDHKINSAFYIGGASLLVETITSMFDVEINHYVQMDFAGFQQVVDSLGGVPVWFPHPVRDPKSHLNITEPGCHVLGGEQALQYVRSRRYTEQIDGSWRITGGDDFSRIARQQDFLVLALDRAISRGARNPTTIAGMIEAGAAFVTIDQALTLGELVSLAQDFSDFNPENLQRQRLEVYTLFWPDGRYKGEAALRQANEPILDVFRGEADSLSPSEVTLTVAGFNEFNLEEASASLAGEGFQVLGSLSSPALPETVVLHGPGHAEAAMTVARYLEPVPYVVSDDDVDGVVVVLGADYGGVLFAFQEPMSVVRDQVRARGNPAILPDPAEWSSPVAAGSAARAPATSGAASVGGPVGASAATAGGTQALAAILSGGAHVLGAALGGGSVVGGADLVAAQSTGTEAEPVTILGRPPEGESCG